MRGWRALPRAGLRDDGITDPVLHQRSRVADRLGAFTEFVVHTPQGSGDPVPAEVLLEPAVACRLRNRLQLRYRDTAGRRSSRAADPHRLVRTRNRWYPVALDVERGQWRTFRWTGWWKLGPRGSRCGSRIHRTPRPWWPTC
ncbi:WYL domain-containing protein [Streptomyces sp. NPDC051172]|uniref:WYL domain-containing protein n=1 Tax=Streptomyces sp. NPDC051172 TaxID=3155796 RepID=UPI003440FC43